MVVAVRKVVWQAGRAGEDEAGVWVRALTPTPLLGVEHCCLGGKQICSCLKLRRNGLAEKVRKSMSGETSLACWPVCVSGQKARAGQQKPRTLKHNAWPDSHMPGGAA